MLSLGIGLILVGTVLGGVAFLWLRAMPSKIGSARLGPRPRIPLDLPDHRDAVLLVRSGGYISSVNRAARELFHLNEDEPDLEKLSQRTKPDHALLALCAAESQASLSIDECMLEGKSYSIPFQGEPAMLVTLCRVLPPEDGISAALLGHDSEDPGLVLSVQEGPCKEGLEDLPVLPDQEPANPDHVEDTAQLLPEPAHLAQWISSAGNSHELYRKLIENFAPKLGVGLLGFLIYDPQQHLLEAQAPFAGLAEGVVTLYQAKISPGSPGDEVLRSAELVISESAPADSRLEALGLKPLAQAAGIGYTVLAPLTAAGQPLGYLQAGAKHDGSPLSPEDLQELAVFAAQAAPVIDYSECKKKSQKQSRQNEILEHITNLASSLASLEDILTQTLQDLSHLLNASLAGIFLGDRRGEELILQRSSALGWPGKSARACERLPAGSLQPGRWTVSGAEISLDDCGTEADADWITFPPCLADLKIQTILVVPLLAHNHLLGQLLLGSRDLDVFSPGDCQAAEIAARLIAGVLAGPALSELEDLKDRMAGAERALEESQKTAQEAKDQLPFLLQKDLENTLALQRLSFQFGRLEACLGILAGVHYQDDPHSVLHSLGQGLVSHLNMNLVLVGEHRPEGIRLLDRIGATPEGFDPEPWLGQQNPLTNCLERGELLVVPAVENSAEWQNSPLIAALNAQGFVCLPFPAGKHASFALLGVLDHPQPSFTNEDLALFQTLAVQTTARLEALERVTEVEQRLREVNLLLDFNRRAVGLDPASILEDLVSHTLKIIPAAQACQVFTWDSQRSQLVSQVAAGYPGRDHLEHITYQPGEGSVGCAFTDGEPVNITEVNFSTHFPLSPDGLLHYREATAGKLPASALAVPIQRSPGAQILGVLLLENYGDRAAFTREMLGQVLLLSQQSALSLEHTRLYTAAEVRSCQLQTMAEIGHRLTSNLQTDELVSTLLFTLKSLLPYDTGTLWLRQGERWIVQAAEGFPDREERLGICVSAGDSALLKEMVTNGKPISIGNTAADPRFPALFEPVFWSWAGIPLIASGTVIGVIALEKVEVDYYSQDQLQIAVMFANQAAAALQNARLYEDSLRRTYELDLGSQRLKLLNEFSNNLSTSLDLAQILAYTLAEIPRAVECSAVSAVLFGSQGEAWLQAEEPQLVPDLPLPLHSVPLFERLHQTRGTFKTQLASNEADLAPLIEYLERHSTQALLVLPFATGNELQGVLLIHRIEPVNFTPEEVDLGRTIASQAAIAIQNARLYEETLDWTQQLEQRVRERTAQLAHEHQQMETLLQITTELSASLDQEQVLHRTLRVLNEVVGAQQAEILVSRTGEERLRYCVSEGDTPFAPDRERQFPSDQDEGLAGWILKHRHPAVIADLQTDPRWIQVPGSLAEHRSAIGVPLLLGSEVLGVLLFFHQRVARFSEDQLDLTQAAAKQIAVFLHNAELYLLIREQAEDLGKMLRQQQVETSRSRAILEAVADGVLVTDAERRITLFNASAEKILGLKREQVLDQSLENFNGLFGKAAQAWMDTLERWSLDPSCDQPGGCFGETFEEQINFEDGRVLSVHLAPVWLQAEWPDNGSFLGTVSTFRDVTHQVEVDRLKSEFVTTASHELRTPLTSIKGYVDLLLMGAAGPLSDGQNHYLAVVQKNINRLTHLIDDLLDLSQIEAGRAALTLQPINLARIAQAAVDNLVHRSREENRPVGAELDFPASLPDAYGDPEHTQVILENLLDNAYHYSPETSPIRVTGQVSGAFVQIEVQDRGIGILPEQQGQIFERFFRGEHPFILATSGNGLGLSIVKHLVEMQGGGIWVTSAGVPGEGSTFSFTLPMAQSIEQENDSDNGSFIAIREPEDHILH